MIRFAKPTDAAAICRIYNYYVANTIITFEEDEISNEAMKERISNISASLPYLVYEVDNQILGYAYATQWKSRSAYRYSVETSVYLDKDSKGLGIGTQLYQRLLEELKTQKVHMAIGGIALPNEGSVALHEKLGFTKIAEFSEVGRKFDQWINVGYWEYQL